MKRFLFIPLYLCACLLAVEVATRIAIKFVYKVPFLQPSQLIYHYYPQLIPIRQAHVSNLDSTLDILVLSCSVLHPEWGDFSGSLKQKWRPSSPYRAIKIYNASGIGHSSLDNLIKRKLLGDKTFDAVIYYDAVNDARLNNCPSEVFRADYSHYKWYDEINTILRHPEMNITVIPFLFDKIIDSLLHIWNRDSYIAVHYSMQADWMKYGNDFKNFHSYKHNLTELLQVVAKHSEQFVFIPFVYYLPKDYSLEKFLRKQADYTFHKNSRETEIWGKPGNIVRFIESINDSCLNWIKNYPNVSSVQMDSFPTDKAHFADVCHFAPAGMDTFAAIIASQLHFTNSYHAYSINQQKNK